MQVSEGLSTASSLTYVPHGRVTCFSCILEVDQDMVRVAGHTASGLHGSILVGQHVQLIPVQCEVAKKHVKSQTLSWCVVSSGSVFLTANADRRAVSFTLAY